MLLEELKVYLRRMALVAVVTLFNLQPLVIIFGVLSVPGSFIASARIAIWLASFITFEVGILGESLLSYAAREVEEVRALLIGRWKYRLLFLLAYLAISLLVVFGSPMIFVVWSVCMIGVFGVWARSLFRGLAAWAHALDRPSHSTT